MTETHETERVDSEYSCAPDARTSRLPKVCNGQRHELTSDNR